MTIGGVVHVEDPLPRGVKRQPSLATLAAQAVRVYPPDQGWPLEPDGLTDAQRCYLWGEYGEPEKYLAEVMPDGMLRLRRKLRDVLMEMDCSLTEH